MNPLLELREAGQGVWLDFLRRSLITGGGLERLVRDDGISGLTSNPSIFSKAIGNSTDYDEAIRRIAEKDGRSALEVFYDVALSDVQMAADVFLPVYRETDGADGFASFELEPVIAHDSAASIHAAMELFERIGKPNAMIKVPGTEEGVPAVEELTALGVNVNITLLFSIEMYEKVARAYIRGLERRREAGGSIDRVASVASFFVSRVDTAADAELPEGSPLRGKVAIANAKCAYDRFRRLFSGDQWERLGSAGARVQRPLWASTGTKNPGYPDVLYVEELVGPDTVNTVPEATLDAFRDHGTVRPMSVMDHLEEAERVLSVLPEHGIDIDAIARRLVEDGLRAFEADLSKLLGVIEAKLEEVTAGRPRTSWQLGSISPGVEERLAQLERDDVVARIWRRDSTVWRSDPAEISDRLGWLGVTTLMWERVSELEAFAKELVDEGSVTAVLLGMGGSSLAPEVLHRVFGSRDGYPNLVVLDTTHPDAIARVERSLDLRRTIFIVASKSGSAIETLSHLAYFFERTGRRGERFVAITDPGTPLEALARERRFRRVFLNPPDIGGRYSALSLFGLVPAAVIGVDVEEVLDTADGMACACHRCVPYRDNPGAYLGAVLGQAALNGRDKLTLVLPAELAAFGMWIEQLIAESTGKDGKGILPITNEDPGPPEVYGADRLFVAYGEHERLEALAEHGHPVAAIRSIGSGLGSEFFRWEFATAVVGGILGINPFDQPNVEEAKRTTREILASGAAQLPPTEDVSVLLATLREGDYFAVQAYVDPTPETVDRLQRMRLAARDRYQVATTVGVGPRYLHSTGQFHKGGPDGGVFVQVIDGSRRSDIPIPGASHSFGELMEAQALGDLLALQRTGRRVSRITLDQIEDIP